jgi:hypothetical protein
LNFGTSTKMAQKAQELLSKATGGKVGHLLPTRKLGKNGPQVTAMGWGAMGLVFKSTALLKASADVV